MKKLNVNINGNKKLVNTSSVRFMIWNLPAVVTCPFATEHCKHFCYARKAERVYPQVLPAREKNLKDSMEEDFVANMIYTIESRHSKTKRFILESMRVETFTIKSTLTHGVTLQDISRTIVELHSLHIQRV